MKIYLSIDYGLAHLGLAISEHFLATPLSPINNDQKTLTKLKQIVSDYQITHIILGLPSGSLEPHIRDFARYLEQSLSLPVILHDETLTTHEAKRQLIASHANRSKRQNEHSVAAALILEDYLESATLS